MDTKTIALGVFAARTLLPSEDKYAAVRLINISSKPYSLWAGRCMGKADHAECLTVGTSAANPPSPPEGAPQVEIQEFGHTATPAGVFESGQVRESPAPALSTPVETGSPTSGQGHVAMDTMPLHLQLMVNQLEGLSKEELAHSAICIYFVADEFDLGCTPLLQHRIDTGDARPLRQGLRRHPWAYLDIIDTQVYKMLKAGIIERSASPWASNVVLVKKAGANTPLVVPWTIGALII